ncbi:MAG TPA: hypothetical protein ENG95_03230 [Nitrospirae bacterium]|nr:hypothetical protein [Nitrospirota bacterium]HDK81044.1 hypothetical protein [Nitrospirota bacterium]HDO25644.1 hypothetical protein [Nitrospirota bacterium]
MRTLIILLVILVAVPAYAEKSGNISLNENWNVWYEKGWSDKPITFHVENILGQPAFKISAYIYCYDRNGKYLGRYGYYEPGPIYKFFAFKGLVPPDTKKMEAEVFNTWEYDP